MWPLTLILTVLGLLGGAFLASNTPQSYSGSLSILVSNAPEFVEVTDYSGIVNSQLFAEKLSESTDIEKGLCTISSVNTGNIFEISVQCPDSAATDTILDNIDSVFVSAVRDIYEGEEEIDTTVLSSEATAPLLTQEQYLFKIFAAGIAGFAIAAVVIFVLFDYRCTKNKRK